MRGGSTTTTTTKTGGRLRVEGFGGRDQSSIASATSSLSEDKGSLPRKSVCEFDTLYCKVVVLVVVVAAAAAAAAGSSSR